MSIINEDNRSIVTNFNVDGIDAVVGIDLKRPGLEGNSEVITEVLTNVGTGNLISPYHVLTAGHVIFGEPEAKVRLGENAASLTSRTRTPLSSGDFDASGTNFSYDTPYVYDAQTLRNFANVQAFGIDDGTNAAGGVTQSQLNFVDSNDGVIVGDASNLSAELLKSDLADDVEAVNILVDGQVVDTITPDQLTDSPMGLTYEGSVDNLDVSIDAENIITAEVVFTPESNLATTTVDYTVTAGQGTVTDADGNPLDESGNEDIDPFERERSGWRQR